MKLIKAFFQAMGLTLGLFFVSFLLANSIMYMGALPMFIFFVVLVVVSLTILLYDGS